MRVKPPKKTHPCFYEIEVAFSSEGSGVRSIAARKFIKQDNINDWTDT